MRALITGIAGFAGRHLAGYLARQGVEVWGTVLPGESAPIQAMARVADITEKEQLRAVLLESKPDLIFHLAAQSSVKKSWQDPASTMRINLIGTIGLLEALRDLCPEARLLLVSSGEVYGSVAPGDLPVSEQHPTRPQNPYALSKLAHELIGQQYARAYGLLIFIARAFNHSGPGQRQGFVIPDFASQVAKIEKGEHEPVIKVGNLEARRDFSDVRDVVRGYLDVVMNGVTGEVYNIGSGRAVSIRYLLNCLLSESRIDITVETDPERYRPLEVPEFYADICKIKTQTGWQPAIPIESTLHDTLEYWRNI